MRTWFCEVDVEDLRSVRGARGELWAPSNAIGGCWRTIGVGSSVEIENNIFILKEKNERKRGKKRMFKETKSSSTAFFFSMYTL